jgi:hypothetical protein
MITLGLDPSLTGFGWCIHNSEILGKDRVVSRGVFSTPAKMLWVERYVFMRSEILKLLRSYPEIEALGVESPPFGEQFSEGLYALFTYVNEAVWSCRKDVVHFDPGTVKMLVKEDPSVRKGKMFKSDMIAAAKADTGIGRWNHNEADAYHIARFAARFWMFVNERLQESDLTPSEHRAFARIHTFVRGKRAGQTVEFGAAFKEGRRFFRFSNLPKEGSNG